MNQPPVENDAHGEAAAPAASGAGDAGSDKVQTAVLGPFGLRDTVVGGSVLLMLIGSLLPWSITFGLEANFWSPLTPLFFLGIGILLPLLVAGLFAARRLAPGLKYRVGSLSVDQFGSVVAVLALAFFFLRLVNDFTVGTLITFVGALGLTVATTLAPHIPPFSAEFAARPEAPAHEMARDAVRLQHRPAAPAAVHPQAAEATAGSAGATADGTAGPGQARQSTRASIAKLAPAGLFGRRSPDAAPDQAGAAADSAASTGAASNHSVSTHSAPNHSAPGSAAAGRPAAGAAGAAAAAAARTDSGATGATAATEPADSTESTRSADSARSTESTSSAATAGSGSDSVRSTDSARAAESAQRPAAPAASAGDEPLAATTVHPVVTGTDASAAEPATQAQAQVPPSGSDSISATREEAENVVEAFWFAVGTPRQIVDERTGLPLFMFHPGDWELGLEDRGHEFLVQDKRTGRIGVLRDLSNIERVSEDSGN